MSSDVLITPSSGLIQFSSSAGSGSGQIKVDGDNLLISNVLGDVLLGDGASDVFIGDGTNNVDIVFEQNGEIRDDTSGKSITLGSKTTNILISGSNTIAMQKGGGNVGIGKTAATKTLEVVGDISSSGYLSSTHITASNNISASGNFHIFGGVLNVDEVRSVDQTTNKLILEDDQSLATNMVSLMSVNFVNIISDGNNNGTGKVRILDGNYDVDSATEVAEFSPEAIELHAPITTNITASGDISASGNITAVSMSGDGSGLTGVSSTATVSGNTFATDLKIGRDADNLIDFTTDNQIQIRVGASNELKINTSTLFPAANDGLSLGGAAIAFSDLFLADGAVIGFNNGEIHLTQADATLVMSGSGATKLEVLGDISSSGDITANELNLTGSSAGMTIFNTNGTEILFNKTTGHAANVTSQDAMYLLAGASKNMFFGSNNVNSQVVLNDGNLSIGAGSSPAQKLVVHGDAHITGSISGSAASTGSFGRVDATSLPNIGYANFTGSVGIGTTSPGEKLEVIGNISASGELSANTIVVGSTITHIGDTNTLISFGTDTLTFKAGNESFITITEDGSQDNIVIGDGGDIDFHVKAGGDNTLFAQGSSQNIGIGTATPGEKLEVVGNISASGIISGSDFHGDGSGLSNVSATVSGDTFATDLKIGRDSDNHIDFTTDNHIILKINNSNELTLSDTELKPSTSNGLALGASNRHWSDLFLAEGGVINFDNGDILLTQTGPLLEMSGSGATKLEVKGDISSSGTIIGNISASGQLIAASADFNEGNISNVGTIDLDTIRGDGDTNTNIAFSGDDVITFKVGNEAVLTLTQGDGALGDIVSVGDAGDVNFRVRTNGEDNTIFVEGSSNNVGIGTSTPGQKLEVDGNISASGGELDVKHRVFDTGSVQLGSNGGGIGDIIKIGDTATVPGAIYQLQGGGTWALTDADAAASATGSIAVALGANSTTNGMLLRGLSKLNHDPGGLVGAPLYLAVAAGSSSNAVPSGNNDIARIVGHNIDASGMIYFNPDNTFVEVSA